MKTDSVVAKLESKIALCLASGYADAKFTELALCREFGVSRTTVRRAVQELKKRGWLSSLKGSGLYIRDKKINSRGLLKNMMVPFILCHRRWSDPRYVKAIVALESAFNEQGMFFSPRTIPAPLKNTNQLLGSFVFDKSPVVILSGDVLDEFILADPGRNGPHYVLFGYYRPNPCHSVVCADIAAGCGRLLRFLDNKKKLALLNGAAHFWIHQNIEASFLKYVRERGLGAKDYLIMRSPNEEGYNETIHILKQLGSSVGILAANNILAMGVYQAVQALGLQIPRQVGVVSVGETEMANSLVPGLTTLCLSENEVARRAVEYVLRYLRESGVKKSARLMIQPEIIARHSA